MESLAAARVALLGTAVGDAFGTMLDGFGPDFARKASMRLISHQRPWTWTDDTAMAISIVEVLERLGAIDPDALAAAFVSRFQRDPGRGYGAGAHDLLTAVAKGTPWRDAAAGLFGGKGSYGNGAAMRAAPIGACFAGDLERVQREARHSALPTHAHADGVAGAVAVAIAAALASQHAPRDGFLDEVIRWTPPSLTRKKLERAAQLGLAFDVEFAGEELGTGANVTSQDTVPFAIWVAARHLDSYEEALWTATAHVGLELSTNVMNLSAIDRDTLGAIVGGIVACAVGEAGIPVLWRAACEPLP